MLPRPVATGSYNCPTSQVQPGTDAVLFASTRLPNCVEGSPLAFTYLRAEQPQFGAAIPPRPGATSRREIVLLTKTAWLNALDAQVKAAHGAAPIVYIHGYDNDQDDALGRAAEIRRAIGAARPVVALTWPSYREKAAYSWDETNAEWSFDEAREIVETVAGRYPFITIVAHSMGNRLALDAIADLRAKHIEMHVDRLIMASPDVDRATARRAFGAQGGIGVPVTLYASTRDQALAGSWRLFHGYPRAGDLSKWVTGHDRDYVFDDAHNLEVVDTSKATHNRLRDPAFHSDFIETPEGASDLCRVLMGLPVESAREPLPGAPSDYSALRPNPEAVTPCFSQK